MKIIDRYILKSHIGPFLFAFITIIFVLVLQFFSTFGDRIIGKGIGFSTILELILLQSAWMVGLAAPMAVLVAVVMAFGSLTTTSEMTVLRASGISLYRLMIPVLCAALFLSLLVERFNNVVLPRANYSAELLMVDVARSKPAFGLTEHAFSTLVDGYSIFVRKFDGRSRELRGIVIHDVTRPNYSTMVTAEKGTLDFSSDYQYLVMTLFNGEIQQIRKPDYKVSRTLSFSKHRFVFKSSGFGFARSSENKLRSGNSELSARELQALSNECMKKIALSEKKIHLLLDSSRDPLAAFANASAVDRERQNILLNQSISNKYMAAYHKKYAISLACFVFVLVGAPLGVLARRGGFGMGAAISLLFFVLYWMLMISGETIAERGVLDPLIAMWLPNMVMASIGVGLMVSLSGAVFNTSR